MSNGPIKIGDGWHPQIIHPDLVGYATRNEGVNAVKWHAIIDGSECETCRSMHGRVWRLTGEPVGHDLFLPYPAYEQCRRGKVHCRCILLPMAYGPDIPFPDGSVE